MLRSADQFPEGGQRRGSPRGGSRDGWQVAERPGRGATAEHASEFHPDGRRAAEAQRAQSKWEIDADPPMALLQAGHEDDEDVALESEEEGVLGTRGDVGETKRARDEGAKDGGRWRGGSVDHGRSMPYVPVTVYVLDRISMAALDRVVPVRADSALLEALDRALVLRTDAAPGVRLTRADVIRSILWDGLRALGIEPPAQPAQGEKAA